MLSAVQQLHLTSSPDTGAGQLLAEHQLALSAFASLCEVPDALWMVCELWDATLASWGSSQRGSRRNTEPSLSEQAGMLHRVLSAAPLLGKASSCSLPHFDATEERHAQVREQAIARFKDRCQRDPLAMLSEDDPRLTFAPMRTIDFLR